MTQLLGEFGTGQVLWDLIWFFLFIIWIYVLFVVFADIFRSDDLGGGAKALWIIFVVIVPWVGVLVYLIARGSKMREHAIRSAQQIDAAQRQYIQSVAGSSNPADEISRLADLKAKGVITDAEFEAGKAKALGS